MSGYSGGSGEGSNSGLDSLFAQLRQQQSKPVNLEPSYSYYNNNNAAFFGQQSQPQPSPAQHHPVSYHQPSISSPLPTPPTHNQNPMHGSAIMSPVETPQPRVPVAAGGASNADRTSSLLNLLKFSQPSSGSTSQPAPIGTPLPPSREPSMSFGGSDVQGQVSASVPGRGGSDLLAALMGSQPRLVPEVKPAQMAQAPQNTFTNSATSPPADTQAYLLQLLNQPKPAQSEAASQLKPAKVLTPPSKASSPDDVEEIAQALKDATLEMNMTGSSEIEGMSAFTKENKKPATTPFTYVNPFDQLAASSPRNHTPKVPTPGPGPSGAAAPAPAIQILKNPRHDPLSDNKRKLDERSTISSPAHTKRKLEVTSQETSGPPTPLPDGRTPLEALIGIGAGGTETPHGKETVHDKLSELGDTVDKQVQDAIARAEREENQAIIEQDLRDLLAAESETEFQKQAELTAQAIKEELEKEENSGALDGLPTPLAEAVKDIIDETAQGHIADSWESADAEAEDNTLKSDDDNLVKVYNFPMKPWIAINIKDTNEARPVFGEESVIDIARLKKEFDQIDRTLVTASGTFIIYGMSKGGVRVISQEDGRDAKIFTETHDRIFSVAGANAPNVLPNLKEAVIATGVSGTVYWVLMKDGEGDHLDDSMPEMYGFALPPVQAHDTETPGGVLKTRARKSSNHPEYFGVGRGKFIHIIFPSVIMKHSYLKHGKERFVDTEKYFKHSSLKINAGKAGKDFTFSEDDSTIVSLDKAGRVKFWDIRPLTKGRGTHSEHIEIVDPLMTLTTTPANEKSWPTSVLFVDKLRPYQKGGALRYLIVGMKQNHSLQLWDLALQKPVQEIHLPHSKESDAVCSVMYHAATGMIIVGHPTRNSIYFLHLSAPKYNLPKTVTQADYIEKILANDPTVLKPDSTAVISGMREYSFANKGSLRSVDILPGTTVNLVEGQLPVMFELYCMHSKGVTCLLITQAALGWNKDNKVVNPVTSPEKFGIISIEALKEINTIPEPSEPATTPAPSVPIQIVPRPTAKEFAPKDGPKKQAHAEASSSTPKAEEKKELSLPNGGLPVTPGTEKAEKKKRRKATTSSESAAGPSSTPQSAQSKTIVLDPSSHARNGNVSRANNSNNTRGQPQQPEMSDSVMKGLESRVTGEIKKSFAESLEKMFQNIKDDRRTQTAMADAKQDGMLRMVSATLSDNIEETLSRIVVKNVQTSVIPALTDVATKAINEQLGSQLRNQVAQCLPQQLQKSLPDAISTSLQQPQLLKLMANSLAQKVAFGVEEQFAGILQNVIAPAFTNQAIQTTRSIVADVQRQATEQISTIERQRHADSIKIEQLTQLVTGLTETISSMAAAQTEFQGQFLRLQKQAASERAASRQVSRQAEASSGSGEGHQTAATSTAIAKVEKTPEEIEYEDMLASIKIAMNEGNYEAAVIQWLQTRREQEFFAKFFIQYSPEFLRSLSPLLLLSLGATISINLEDQFMERISWMETILNAFQRKINGGELEDQVRDLIPKIIGIYVQRIEHLFMRVSNVSAQDPSLKRLSAMVSMANRILEYGPQPSYESARVPSHSASGSVMSGGRHYQ